MRDLRFSAFFSSSSSTPSPASSSSGSSTSSRRKAVAVVFTMARSFSAALVERASCTQESTTDRNTMKPMMTPPSISPVTKETTVSTIRRMLSGFTRRVKSCFRKLFFSSRTTVLRPYSAMRSSASDSMRPWILVRNSSKVSSAAMRLTATRRSDTRAPACPPAESLPRKKPMMRCTVPATFISIHHPLHGISYEPRRTGWRGGDGHPHCTPCPY